MIKILIFALIALFVLVAILSWGNYRFERKFRNEVTQNLLENRPLTEELLTEKDLAHLPEPVKKYLMIVGVLNKPRVYNFYVEMEGYMRGRGQDYFPFTCRQYDFLGSPARLFYMKGKMMGVNVPGYHRYMNTKASMDIRLFGLIPVVQKKGEVMNKAETVTLLNDLCIMAPATLIDPRIRWQAIDPYSARAIFTNQGITVSAILYFNERGEMIDFLSNDRTDVSDMKSYPFTTPMLTYGDINGYHLCTYGEAVWHYPEDNFTYGKFRILKVIYNVKK